MNLPEADFRVGIIGVGDFTPMKPNTKMTPDIPDDRNPANMGRSGSSYGDKPIKNEVKPKTIVVESKKAVEVAKPVMDALTTPRLTPPLSHSQAIEAVVSNVEPSNQPDAKETLDQRKQRLTLDMMKCLKEAFVVGRSSAGVINLAYDSIIEARSSGLSLEELTEKVNESGVKISKKVLSDALYRIRGRRRSEAKEGSRAEPKTPEEIMVEQASSRLESMKRASKSLSEIIHKMSRTVREATASKGASIKEDDKRVVLLRNLVGAGILSGEVRDAIESILDEVCDQ